MFLQQSVPQLRKELKRSEQEFWRIAVAGCLGADASDDEFGAECRVTQFLSVPGIVGPFSGFSQPVQILRGGDQDPRRPGGPETVRLDIHGTLWPCYRQSQCSGHAYRHKCPELPMGIRFSLGPVFAYEARRAVRSWHMYAHRTILGMALLAATYLIWHIKTEEMAANPGLTGLYLSQASLSLRVTAAIAQIIFHVMVAVQLAFVFLISPPAVAGTVCQDRLSGALADMLASGLSAWEIVLGRLAARLVAVLSTIGCTIPVASALMLLGGIEVKTIIAAVMVTTGVAILGSTLALALSVGRGKTHEVTLITYAILGLVFFLDPFVVWIGNLLGWRIGAPPGASGLTSVTVDITGLEILNPFWLALAPYYQPGRPRLEQPTIFLVGSIFIGS
jgi:hypothetical protein